jgi:MFS transporter, DHA2 family, multidrug resistance protein
MHSTHPSPTASRREWIGLAALALPCMLTVMDLTVLNMAVPRLSADLQPSSTQLLWIIDMYGFMLAGALITMGTLGDRIGRRRLLLIGAAAFGLASTFAAFAGNATILIVARAVLGIAGATLVPSTLSLIRNMFHDERERATAIGLWGSSFAIGAIIGPLVGGALLEHFWWGSAFLVAVPVMVLLLIVGPLLLPEYRDPGAGRPDAPSALLSLAAVLAVIYGVKQIAAVGPDPLPIGSVAVGIGLGLVFVRRQQLLLDPLVDLGLFRSAALNVALATNALSLFVSFGSFLFIAQYLQLTLGLSPLQAGAWTLPASAAAVLAPNLAPIAAAKLGRAATVSVALVITAAGFALITQATGASALPFIVIGWAAWAFGGSAAVTLGTGVILTSAPPERAGAVSALVQTCQELGGALGVAMVGSLGAAAYRAFGSMDAATAWSSDVGLHLSALIGAVLMLAMAIVAPVYLRERPAEDQSRTSLRTSAAVGGRAALARRG